MKIKSILYTFLGSTLLLSGYVFSADEDEENAIKEITQEVALYGLIKNISESLNCGILLISHDLHVVMSAQSYHY